MNMQKYYCQGMKFYGDKVDLPFYNNTTEDTLFIGLYFSEDYEVFNNHQSKITVFWNGSDVLRLLDNTIWQGIITSKPAKHYCHNKQLQDELKLIGINAEIVHLFFGNKKDYQVCYKPAKPPHIFLCAHPDRETEYGVDKVLKLAEESNDFVFHIYGISMRSRDNLICHGQVLEEQMDQEIQNYQGCLRFNKHDGMSQIVAKAGLMGLYPIVTTDLNEARIKLQKLKTEQEPYKLDRNSIIDINEFLEMVK